MEYSVNKILLLPQVEEIVSREAAMATNDVGASQYDFLKITSRDDNTLDRLFMDAENTVVARFKNVVSYSESNLEFNLPDFDESLAQKAQNLLDNYVIYHVVSYWFALKKAKVSEEYAVMAKNYIDTAVNVLYQRMNPQN